MMYPQTDNCITFTNAGLSSASSEAKKCASTAWFQALGKGQTNLAPSKPQRRVLCANAAEWSKSLLKRKGKKVGNVCERHYSSSSLSKFTHAQKSEGQLQ